MAATKDTTGTGYEGFTAEERDAMKQRAKELKASAKAEAKAADAEKDVLAKIAKLNPADRVLAEGFHALVKEHAPELTPRTWYGMPAYARDGKIVCHFQPAEKFKTRYPTITFSDEAKLDDGVLWPVSFALTELNAGSETAIAELLKGAMG
ncbi:iron chaperone [Phytomonospora endophytica]|uniref:Uncharacterized protein YdhG (YjbR/CyaY superfamily) n=1 Tax=Phytomonospora endophytica TaxID=714109 RepID=A0A841FBS1_9ACTN|nr:hypothetical protein [Phytomonospora endophytica]MBB6034731.1 uncharacterized protein YdhG (YjbR/CyaY superfamily) [Phytomonospora endophytica]GIG69065.1 hypothetical protein Pen01_53600 [Phytomonospora endophytica]